VAFGLPLAFVLARRSFLGKGWLEAVIDLPIVLPPSVAGLALLIVLGRRGILGGPLEFLGMAIPFTTIAVILAQTFVSAPFFIRSARTGIASVSRDLEDAARVDGASERQLFRRITMPLASAALAAGLVMTWARSLGEFGATIMFAGNVEGRTQTLPLVVYGEFQNGNLDSSIAAAAILVLAAFGVPRRRPGVPLESRVRRAWDRLIDFRATGAARPATVLNGSAGTSPAASRSSRSRASSVVGLGDPHPRGAPAPRRDRHGSRGIRRQPGSQPANDRKADRPTDDRCHHGAARHALGRARTRRWIG